MQLPLVLMWLVLLCGTWTSAQTGCPRNCERCVVGSPRCESCGPGTTLSMDLRECLPCPTGCVDCRTSAATGARPCIRCPIAHGLTRDGKCTPCVEGCRRCHYDLGPRKLVCDECGEPYAGPDVNGTCQVPEQGKYRDVIHGQLHTCPPHAQHCKDVGARHPLITRCQDGYTLSQDSHDPTLYTCVHVAGPPVQGRVFCAQGYVYIQDARHLQCQKCTPKKPVGSRSAYYLDAARDCKRCPPYALECYRDNEDIMQVMQCQSGYEIYYDGPDSDQECLWCPARCLTCETRTRLGSTRQLKCRECRQGYYELLGDCEACPQHCHTCDSRGQCRECRQGYYELLGDCEECPPHCHTCDSRGQCQQCDVTYMLADTSCVRCPDNCEVCDESGCTECGGGYAHLARDDYYCMPCAVPHCARCDIWGNCEACDAGWYVKQHRCVEPPEHCVEVKTEDPESCDLCAAGYGSNYTEYPRQCYPCGDLSCCNCKFNATPMERCVQCPSHGHCVNGNCTLNCTENCADCPYNYNECKACDAGYYVDDGAKCSACQRNCERCYNYRQCQKCDAGYVLNNGWCYRCRENCVKCNRYRECSVCDSGYYLSSGSCYRCRENCVKCYNSDGCEKCDAGYYVGDGARCTCPENCVTCYNAEQCEECADGFHVNASGQCETCPPRHFVDASSRECRPCSGPWPAHCARCGEQGCEQCEQGFALWDTNTCVQCPQHCGACYVEECEDSRCIKCTQCAHAHGRVSPGSTLPAHWCAPCPAHCAACTYDSIHGDMQCDRCSDYALATDVEGATECVAVTERMECGGAAIVIPAARCELDGCVHGTNITADYKCALQCYACEEGAGRCNGSTVTCVTGTCSVTPNGAAGCGGDTCEQNICGNAASSTEPCCCSTHLCNVRPTSKSPAPAIHLFCFFLATALSLIG